MGITTKTLFPDWNKLLFATETFGVINNNYDCFVSQKESIAQFLTLFYESFTEKTLKDLGNQFWKPNFFVILKHKSYNWFHWQMPFHISFHFLRKIHLIYVSWKIKFEKYFQNNSMVNYFGELFPCIGYLFGYRNKGAVSIEERVR